jgi:hypothetical protein
MQASKGQMEDKKDNTLKIVANGQKVLSKNQKLFNQLTKRIQTLEKEIVREDEKLSKLLTVFGKEITPLQVKLANQRIQLAMTLDRASKHYKFTKRQTENIRETILTLCNEAFVQIEPSPEQEAFYNKWSETTYKEEMEEQKNESKEMFSDLMSDMFGFDVNMEDMGDNPEDFARLHEKIKEQFEQSQKNNKHQKKSNKQQKREEAQKSEEEIKNKSIRNIYIALAKVLHPDAEMDTAVKLEKEEIMKKVTVAYDQKDLSTLLKLEMEWVHKTTEHLDQLADDKLKIYISALKQQVSELEREKLGLLCDPRYSQISSYIHLAENSAINQILKEKKDFKNFLKSINTFITTFEMPNAKNHITQFVQNFCEENEQDDFDEFDDFGDYPF